MQKSLKNKTALIAGGAKNLGGLITRKLADEGANILIHYNSMQTKKDAEETLKYVESKGANGLLFQSNFSDIKNIEKAFLNAKNAFGGIDIAINTIGKVLKKPYLETTEQDFDEMDIINNKIAYFFIQSAGKHLNNNGKICTIVTSLLAAYTGLYSTYGGLKSPVEHYTRAASKEFGGRGISVNAVAPGPMDTPFFYGQETPEAVEYNKSASALGGLTKIENIEPLVKFLVTEGSWITGQTIFANGGYTTR